MRLSRGASIAAVGVALSGCVYGYQSTTVFARLGAASRPDPSYYCYDCHGYRFFDPYYDWCTYYGFRYDWGRQPRTTAVYRHRYVRIRETNRGYGRYRYPGDYREMPRYREPRDYQSWSDERSRPREPSARDSKRREKRHEDQGSHPQRKERSPRQRVRSALAWP